MSLTEEIKQIIENRMGPDWERPGFGECPDKTLYRSVAVLADAIKSQDRAILKIAARIDELFPDGGGGNVVRLPRR